MTDTIQDYALIGDRHTAALVGASGSVDWLCLPQFDSEACFASMLGDHSNGRWLLAPDKWRACQRRYRPGTLILETTYETRSGSARVLDFMPERTDVAKLKARIIRIVTGLTGTVSFSTEMLPRFDYGSVTPRIEKISQRPCLIAGGDRMVFDSDLPLDSNNRRGALTASFSIKAGQTRSFSMSYGASYDPDLPPRPDPEQLLRDTEDYWLNWCKPAHDPGEYAEIIERSLIILKALSFAPSGGFVAAPTTSLPEYVGGKRNWDYRFCWLRDATFCLLGLIHGGHMQEARDWMDWLARAIGGNPDSVRIMYGISGKREHSEWVASWLPGYEKSGPVRIGNSAASQLQLDVFGEVIDTLYHARCAGIYPHKDKDGEELELPLLRHLEDIWQDPDCGMWETRGKMKHFTESKVMAWVAFDRAVKMAEQFGLRGPVDRWRKLRDTIHRQVLRKGFHRGMNSFTRAYGSKHLDASLLRLPLVGFLPADDPRIIGTVEAIEHHLMRDGLLLRYDTRKVEDGLPAGEGAFLACSFWLVDVYVLQGKHAKAKALFDHLLSIRNDVGLLSEEYDPRHRKLVGNMPQAFSHIALINSAMNLSNPNGPAHTRATCRIKSGETV